MLFIVSLQLSHLSSINFLLFDVGNTLEMHWTTDLFRIWYNFYIRAAEHAFDSALKVWMNQNEPFITQSIIVAKYSNKYTYHRFSPERYNFDPCFTKYLRSSNSSSSNFFFSFYEKETKTAKQTPILSSRSSLD